MEKQNQQLNDGAANARVARYDRLRRGANPAILNEERLPLADRLILNRVAAYMTWADRPSRYTVMTELSIDIGRANRMVGYLMDSGLIQRLQAQKKAGVPAHYAPTDALLTVIDQPVNYSLFEAAHTEQLAQSAAAATHQLPVIIETERKVEVGVTE